MTPADPSAWLDSELGAVRGELARIDSKCGVLTAIATGAAALAAAEVSGHASVLARGVFAAAAGAETLAALLLAAWITWNAGLSGGGGQRA